MRSWDLNEISTPGGKVSPVVLASEQETRAVLIGLEPGQELGDHEVKERAWLLVVDGAVEVEADGDRHEASEGTLMCFAPEERRRIRSADGARILLLFAPWPGEGHYRGGDAPPARSF